MAKSRRMQKQGPPQPLDESKITSLKKRKATEAANAEPETKSDEGKKRKKGKVQGKEKGKGESVDEVDSVLKEAPKKKVNGTATNGKATKDRNADNKKKAKLIESDDQDDDVDGLQDDGDGLSGSEDEMMGDEFDNLDGVSEGSIESQDDESEDGDAQDDSVFDSDEEDHPREAMFSDDEDDSDAEERITAANIEGLSNKLDAQQRAEEAEAEREMKDSALQTNITSDRPDLFAGVDDATTAPDLHLLRTRITDTIRVLGDLKTLGQPGKSRTDYVDLLIKDICLYYGYTPFMAEKLFNLFTPMEAFAFFEANETARPVVIRTNTLHTNRRSLAQALINKGVVLEPLGKWTKVGLQVFESPVPLGATPEYLAGHYILQAASSFLPVMALAPQPNERILDMAAAPGGKTTYISALLRNTGCVIANDSSKPRAKGLIGNIQRLGCKNTIVTNLDSRTAFPKTMGGFDRILLDAPCTGTGVISKDSSVKTSKNEQDFQAIPHMQRQLLVAAINSVDHNSKTGGYIVYSTCSVTIEENENVIQYILRKFPGIIKIVDTGLPSDFGSNGFTSYMGKQFDPKMSLTRRYFPHKENVDGFFVCKLKKIGPSPAAPIPKGSTDGVSSSSSTVEKHDQNDTDGEVDVVDKTPITEDGSFEFEGGAFGPFDDDEDAQHIARAERNRIRRKGYNPNTVLDKPKAKAKANGKGGSKKK